MEDPSQFNQATYLLKFLNYKSGFFIEAGANDGVSMSNTDILSVKKIDQILLLRMLHWLVQNIKKNSLEVVLKVILTQ